MPWFPDFVSAMELARLQDRAEGRADPVGRYLAALNEGNSRALEDVWPGEVVVYDPHAGEVRGHKQLRRLVRRSRSLLAARHARIETAAATVTRGRAVVELLAHLVLDGHELTWPVAVVAECFDERSVEFRSYFCQRSLDGKPHTRPPILNSRPVQVGDVVGRYQAALAAGDAERMLSTFEPDGYFREPLGPRYHRGPAELRAFFHRCFSAGGGITLEPCEVTDDGVRCAMEYNCLRWGDRELMPQAGIGVYERGADGLLAAVRVYDDVEVPDMAASVRSA